MAALAGWAGLGCLLLVVLVGWSSGWLWEGCDLVLAATPRSRLGWGSLRAPYLAWSWLGRRLRFARPPAARPPSGDQASGGDGARPAARPPTTRAEAIGEAVPARGRPPADANARTLLHAHTHLQPSTLAHAQPHDAYARKRPAIVLLPRARWSTLRWSLWGASIGLATGLEDARILPPRPSRSNSYEPSKRNLILLQAED